MNTEHMKQANMFDPDAKNLLVVTHTYYDSSGTPDAELVRFLRGKAAHVLFILHPFPDATTIPLNTTISEYGPDGNLVRKKNAPLVSGNPVLSYIKDFLFTLWYVIRSKRIYDLCICADNLNTLAGLVLRMVGRVRRVAYYVIDFTPVRFPNRVMNAIYQSINKFACYHADVIWNVSGRMADGREEIGIKRSLSAPQITVPLGCSFGTITRKDAGEVNPADIVYFGSLRREHGPGLIIEAIPEIARAIPGVSVTFAGDGDLRGQLEERAKELGVGKHVRFTGYIDSGEKVYEILATSGLALATYPPGEDTYKTFSDPGKVKIYLACGLPVLITDVPQIAREIHDRGAGRIVEWNAEYLAKTVIDIAGNRETYRVMRENAVRLGSEYDWDAIWERTFAAMNL